MRRGMLVAMALSILAGSWEFAEAQAALPAGTVTDVAAAADTTVPDTTHHKKGLFGKAKSVMKNKVVQQVVKTAACTMVPGGQAIAGAIDAAAGASCMPGLGGAGMGAAGLAGAGAGMAAGGTGGAGLAGLAGAPAGGAAAYAPGMAVPGMAPMGAYGMGADPKPMADCMGVTVEEYQAMTNPTGGEARAMTKDEMKRAQKLSKKVGSERQMGCSQQVGMQQASAQMAAMQEMMSRAAGKNPPVDPVKTK